MGAHAPRGDPGRRPPGDAARLESPGGSVLTRSRRPHVVRLFPLLCLALLVCAGFPGAGSAGSAARGFVSFTFVPQRAYQNAFTAVSINVHPRGVRCSLSVRYARGGRQAGLEPVRAANGAASWKWRVSTGSVAGPARVTASCGGAGSASQTIVVVG